MAFGESMCWALFPFVPFVPLLVVDCLRKKFEGLYESTCSSLVLLVQLLPPFCCFEFFFSNFCRISVRKSNWGGAVDRFDGGSSTFLFKLKLRNLIYTN